MPEKATRKSKEKEDQSPKEKEIFFKCRFCGKTRPLSELVVMRQYFPQMSACKTCARGVKNSEISSSSPD
jgi:transcription elongation factor Elf1